MSFVPVALTAVGSIMEGVAASRAEQFNASVSRANAQAIRQSADLDIQRQRRSAQSMRSTQQARYGKAGVKLEGSPLEVMLDSASQAELDAQITDYNARVNMAQAEAQASQYETQAKTYMRKGVMSAAKTLLSSDLKNPFALKQEYATTGQLGRVPVAPANYYKRG